MIYCLLKFAYTDVHTEDDSATTSGLLEGRNDYDGLSTTTLSFYPNTTSLPVNIGINADMICEEEESFRVILDNPLDAVLGSPSEIDISINDDDSKYNRHPRIVMRQTCIKGA